jgi:hypothetical protein
MDLRRVEILGHTTLAAAITVSSSNISNSSQTKAVGRGKTKIMEITSNRR